MVKNTNTQKPRFPYFCVEESELFSFYRIPKALFTDERFKAISAEAKILYGIMLDRMSLSRKNGWVDEENHVYIVFTAEDAMEFLNCARQKAFSLLSELDAATGIGLIEKKRRGLGKVNLTYVLDFRSPPDSPGTDGWPDEDKKAAKCEATEKNEHSSSANAVSAGGKYCKDSFRRSDKCKNAETVSSKPFLESEPVQDDGNPSQGSGEVVLARVKSSRSSGSMAGSNFQKYENHTSGNMNSPDNKKYDNHTSASMEIILPEVRKSYSNNTELNNNTKMSETEYLSDPSEASPASYFSSESARLPEKKDGKTDKTAHSVCEEKTPPTRNTRDDVYGMCEKIFRRRLATDDLLTLYGPAKIDQIIHLIARTMSSDRPNLTIGGEKIPADRIRQRLMKIRSGHVSYVLDSLRKVTRPIRNMRGYLLTSLCNAVETLPFTKWQQGMILEGQEESNAAWDDDDDSSGKGSAPSTYDYNEAIALSNGWRTAG